MQAKYTAPGGPPAPVHTDTWWLDAVTRQMVEQRLNLSGMLTFTLRGGRPINLTREQVRHFTQESDKCTVAEHPTTQACEAVLMLLPLSHAQRPSGSHPVCSVIKTILS